jgi:hypothetical protein
MKRKPEIEIDDELGDESAAIKTALGEMVIAWSHADTELIFMMAYILNIDPNMAAMGYYHIPTFESRVKFIRSIIPEWKMRKSKREAVDKAIDKLSGLARARNNWIHNSWGVNHLNQAVITNLRARIGFGRVSPVSANDIQIHVEAVHERTVKLIKLRPLTKYESIEDA